MKAVVTGGVGFIGSHLVEALHVLDVDTHVIDNLSSGNRTSPLKRGMLHVIDVRDELAKEIIVQEKPDVVFHLAAQADVNTAMRDPVRDASINILGTLNMLQAAQIAKVKHFIFASSSAVYGESTAKSRENDNCNPVSNYGMSKLVSEMYIQKFRSYYGLPFTILRYANVYGPGQAFRAEGAVVTAFIHRMKDGRPLTIYGDGEQQRDFVYVKDVVQANMVALHNGPSNSTYNVSTGTSVSINTVANHLRSIHKCGASVRYEDCKIGDSRYSCLDNMKIQLAFGWHPTYTLTSGLLHTYRSVMDADD